MQTFLKDGHRAADPVLLDSSDVYDAAYVLMRANTPPRRWTQPATMLSATAIVLSALALLVTGIAVGIAIGRALSH